MKSILNCLFFAYFIFNFNQSVLGQRLVKITPQTPICAAEGDVVHSDRWANKASTEAVKIIEDICTKIGVNAAGFTIEAATVANAEAIILDGKRYIHYNPLYMDKIQQKSQTYWSLIFVLAHEIGHHISGHTLLKTDIEKCQKEELEADKFAGCALRHLGTTAEELEKAVSFLPAEGGRTHPPRDTRLMFATIGWKDCAPAKISEISDKSVTPTTQKPIDCGKETGDVYFKNATKGKIRIFWTPQSGWREMTPRLTLEAGETGGILDLKAEKNTFLIQSLTADAFGGLSFTDYKNEETRVKRCADESQKPIIIR
jgi:hypothetical protein